MVFQRPERASFISTLKEAILWQKQQKCFNALNGLLSFLRETGLETSEVILVFQRPERASFISTGGLGLVIGDSYKGFNALNGLLSFLPQKNFSS